MSAQLTYGTYAFHEHGDALYSLARTFDNAENGRPSAVSYRYTLKFSVFDDRFADIEAILGELRDYLDAHPEEVLLIRDEDGTVLHNRRVRIQTDTLADGWRQYHGEITLVFHGRDTSLSEATADATYTPVGGVSVTLANIAGGRESLRTDRIDPYSGNRRESRLVISLNGSIHADTTLSETDRRTYLIERKAAMQTAANAAKEGTLVFGGESRVVRLETLDADLAGDGSDRLDWSAAFYLIEFPDGDYAEAEFETATQTSHETGEVTLTVSGTIRAGSGTLAVQKARSIRDYYQTGRALISEDEGEPRHHGIDSVAELSGDPISLRFSYTFRETNVEVLNWELRIATRTDDRTGLEALTYSGRVVAQTYAVALAKARELGDNKHPFRIGSSEDASYRKMGSQDAERFIELTFSYDYERRSNSISYAEISSQTSRDPFGTWTITVSGYTIAATESAATTLGRSYKLTSHLPITDQETVDSVTRNETQFRRFSFTYGYQVVNGIVSIEWQETDQRDWETLNRVITYDGICRGPAKATCEAAVISLVSLGGNKKTNEVFSSLHRQTLGNSLFEGLRFTITLQGTLASGSAPGQIIDAEYTLSKTGSVNHAVITPIPFGSPHVQTNCGVTPGECRITGTATGFSSSALTSWATSKKSLAPGSGHEEPPQLDLTTVSPKWQPTAVLLYRVSFTWTYRYASLTI